MLRLDQCWRCDTICPAKIYCGRCKLAYYCSDECKRSDEFRHQVDCQTATLKRKCSSCGKESTELQQCGSCLQAWYCNQECLKKAWPTHKVTCREVTKRTNDLCDKVRKYFHLRDSTGSPGLGILYYWGNFPATDFINLALNEGCDYTKPLSALVCGVGDPRNVALSLAQLPESYEAELTFVLNDICACTLARTVLILYLLLKGGEQVASSVTQIWYSLGLSEDDFQLVIRTLHELIEASSLEELTQGRMKIHQSHFQRIIEVWCTWIQLSSRGGDWITEARRRQFEDPEAKNGMDMYLMEIPKEHKRSASEWFANGILLANKSREVLPRENFTLTGSDFLLNNNRGAFSYILQSSVLPFCGWDYNEVRRWGYSACILKMYSEYVSHVLKKCALRMATDKVEFHFLLCNCMEITPFLPAGWKFDRVTTFNIADFVPLTQLLDTFKPFLNLNNSFAVIITEFLNWVQLTNLQIEAMTRAHFMPRGDSFRKKVLHGTNNPAISSSRGLKAFMEYHDHSAEFIHFLRASLLSHEIPAERNGRRKWISVADYNGLIARNFLRCRNRIVPSRWMLNCRRVTILNGYERAVEWILKPK